MDSETKSVGTMEPITGKSGYSTRKKPVIAEQKRYESVSDFCDHYGLRYTSVQYHLRQGKTGDEVLAILRQRSVTRRYSKAPGRGIPVKIGDDVFQSVSEAAMAYGVSNAQIEDAMVDGIVNPALLGYTSRQMKECIVAGVTYPSMAAAARAYGIPMVTVQSRMLREKISFEEALRRGHMERHRIVAEHSKWPGMKRDPFEGELEGKKFTKDLLSLLEQNNYHPHIFQDPESGIFAVQIQESLEAISRPLDIYILYDETELSRDIEFIIPEIGKQRILSDAKQVLLYQQINEVNEQYVGSKIFLRNRMFSASWSITHTSRSIQATAFMRSFYRFIGSTAGIWEMLKWAEQEAIPAE